jgi:hypothetical protein
MGGGTNDNDSSNSIMETQMDDPEEDLAALTRRAAVLAMTALAATPLHAPPAVRAHARHR